MRKNYEVVISDASCLIALDNINALHILSQCFSKVYTTPEVATEYGKSLPDFVKIKTVKNIIQLNDLKRLIDDGEASAITLAIELPESFLIIDEKKGRKVAKSYNLKIIGTLKVLLIAKKIGVLTEIKPLLTLLQQKGFRVSKTILETLLNEAGE